MKKVGIIKRIFALLLIFLLSINSFGAVVSDNDGSSFITKAEFDSLKNNFQSQIDNYNQSIDSKIDGAIAQYLAGIVVQNTALPLDMHQEYEKFKFFSDIGMVFPIGALSGTYDSKLADWATAAATPMKKGYIPVGDEFSSAAAKIEIQASGVDGTAVAGISFQVKLWSAVNNTLGSQTGGTAQGLEWPVDLRTYIHIQHEYIDDDTMLYYKPANSWLKSSGTLRNFGPGSEWISSSTSYDPDTITCDDYSNLGVDYWRLRFWYKSKTGTGRWSNTREYPKDKILTIQVYNPSRITYKKGTSSSSFYNVTVPNLDYDYDLLGQSQTRNVLSFGLNTEPSYSQSAVSSRIVLPGRWGRDSCPSAITYEISNKYAWSYTYGTGAPRVYNDKLKTELDNMTFTGTVANKGYDSKPLNKYCNRALYNKYAEKIRLDNGLPLTKASIDGTLTLKFTPKVIDANPGNSPTLSIATSPFDETSTEADTVTLLNDAGATIGHAWNKSWTSGTSYTYNFKVNKGDTIYVRLNPGIPDSGVTQGVGYAQITDASATVRADSH